MDIDALHSALLSITVVSEKIRAAREMLSATGDAPARLGKFLCEAENDLRMAKATLGGELGFSLCPRCWPPELVATDLDGKLNCPVCGRVSHEQAAWAARWVKSNYLMGHGARNCAGVRWGFCRAGKKPAHRPIRSNPCRDY